MKRILFLILFLSIYTASYSQQKQPIGTAKNQVEALGELTADSVIKLPTVKKTYTYFDSTGNMAYVGGVLYIHNGTVWQAYGVGTGTVTSIATSTGILGGTITSSGTLQIDSSVVPKWDDTLSGNYKLVTKTTLADTSTALRALLTSGTVTSVNTGYGLTGGPISTTGTIVADTGTLFPKLVSTLGAGYGLILGGRTYKVDTATLAAYIRSTVPPPGAGTVTSVATSTGIIGGTITTSGTLQIDSSVVPKWDDTLAGNYKLVTKTILADTSAAIRSALTGGTVTNVATGYGLSGGPITSAGTIVADTATLFAKIVSTLGAGYGLLIGGRTYKVDTATLAAYIRGTIPPPGTGTVTQVNNGLYITGGPITTTGAIGVDTANLLPQYAASQTAGYGLIYGGRTYKFDSATVLAYMASTLAAGTGLTYGGRTFSLANIVTAGTYAYPSSVTTNAQGQVTSITAGSAPTSYTAGNGLNLTGSRFDVDSTKIPFWYDTTTGYRKLVTPTYLASFAYGTGTVTSVVAGTGLIGGTITATGTISMPNTGAAGTYGSSTTIPSITTDVQGRVTAVTTNTFTATPSGSAGGSLGGSYPNPSIANSGVTAGSYGSATVIPGYTVNVAGQITAVTSYTVTGGGGGSPGGSTTQVQYNNAGAFAGSSNFTFDGTNVAVNNIIYGVQSYTATGTQTLTALSPRTQRFFGTTATLLMPATSTLSKNQDWDIVNDGSGNLTINSSGGNLIQTLHTKERCRIVDTAITGTTAIAWYVTNFQSKVDNAGNVTMAGNLTLPASGSVTINSTTMSSSFYQTVGYVGANGGFLSDFGTPTSGNFNIGNGSGSATADGSINSTFSGYRIAGGASVNFRTAFGGATSTVATIGADIENTIFSNGLNTTAASGTHGWGFNVGIDVFSPTIGTATITNAASLYVKGTAINGTNNYGIYDGGNFFTPSTINAQPIAATTTNSTATVNAGQILTMITIIPASNLTVNIGTTGSGSSDIVSTGAAINNSGNGTVFQVFKNFASTTTITITPATAVSYTAAVRTN